MDSIQIIFPYYENPNMLRLQIEELNCYKADVAAKIEVILVDDGSPRNPALPVILEKRCQIPFSVYRVKKNIPFNQHGARNLGATVADEGWMLMLDMDEVLIEEEAEKLLSKELDQETFYEFEGVNYLTMEPKKWPPNQILLTKELYWKAGGYNEDFCGTYGGDSWLIANLELVGDRVHFEDVVLANVDLDTVPDACTLDWDRDKYKQKYIQKLRKKPFIRAENPIRFDWEKLL